MRRLTSSVKAWKGTPSLQDTLQKQRDYVTANSARLEHQLQLLQEAVKQQAPDFNRKNGAGSRLPG